MIDLLGATIHEPDVVFTDLGLAILGAYFGRRLWTRSKGETLTRGGGVLMGGLASAAFWGAIFHAFFPAETATPAGFTAWIPVVLSILVAAATMLLLSLRLLAPRLPRRVSQLVVGTYAAVFALIVLVVDESFSSIVRFYIPALILFLIAAGQQATRWRSAGWALITTGLLMSVLAALLQQAGVSIHPAYFDHNAVYHVLQSIALVFLYLGFRRATELGVSVHATGTNPASRPR